MTARETAQRLHEQHSTAAADYEAMMGADSYSNPIARMTVDEIEAFLVMVEEIGLAHGLQPHQFNSAKFSFDTTREQIEAAAQAKNKNFKKRTGVRALVNKYGHDAATNIVRRHSGRSIR